MSESTTTPPDVAAPDGADPARPWYWALLGVAVVVLLAAVTRFLESAVPAAAEGTGFAGVAKAVEYPVYAILLGLAANAVLSALGIRR
ncbi:MAG: putative sulfate exporter family transporter, partial [Thermobifida fusca]|nr:putative sulfate exporter family transporter [Thermobifida fusca]